MNWQILGKYMVTAGTIIIFIGVLMLLADRFFLARLPGDIAFQKDALKFTIPFATITLVGIGITLIVNFFSK